MSDVVIYHNPTCGTSRNVLALLREKGIEPKVVEYLKVGWTADQLADLVTATGGNLNAILRVQGTQAQALGLTDPAVPEARVIAAMIRDPILVNRPIVVTVKGAALCRPAERVFDLL